MYYGIKIDSTIYVTAATDLAVFQEIEIDITDGVIRAEPCDMVEMFTEPLLKDFTLAPFVIECATGTVADAVASSKMIAIQSPSEARNTQDHMMELARLKAEFDQPKDRRTLAEIHGFDDNADWDKRSDAEKEASRKQDEKMREVRAAGGLTSGSFESTDTENLKIHGVSTVIDADKNIVSASVNASKNTMSLYRLTVEGDAVDFNAIFDDIGLPENRVKEQEANHAVIKLHDHQIERLTETLERFRMVFTINKVGEGEEESDEGDLITGHENVNVFWSVQIDHQTVSKVSPILLAAGLDQNLVVLMRNAGPGCWYAFLRESDAKDAAGALKDAGIASEIIAVNRRGQSIFSGTGAGARIVDRHVEDVVEPRPWNDRAHEIDAMTDEQKAELMKGVKTSEFIVTVESTPRYKALVRVQPESYFRAHDALWEAPLHIDKMVAEHVLKPIEGAINAYSCSAFDAQLLKDNLMRWGFIDSLLLRMHFNDLESEMKAELYS
jgi:hypothetical protein